MSLLRKLLPAKQWFLLWNRGDIPNSFGELKRLTPDKNLSWADPFPVADDNGCTIFIEEVVYKPSKKGHIAVMRINNDGEVTPPKTIINRDYHLSYPFVFEYDDTQWMIPESRSNQTVELYRCSKWPDEWVFEKNIFENRELVDTTVFEHKGFWWLMCCEPETAGGNARSRSLLYYADSPISNNWTPHPKNPVVNNIHAGRPGGRPFMHEGRLIRPAQDSSKHYGYALRLMEITSLDTETYEEREFKAYLPDWDPKVFANHSFNLSRDWILADAAHKV